MNSTTVPARPWAVHPFHAAVLGGVWPLFLGALLSDYAYWSSYQIQWSNFASWLLVGAMVLTTIALVCAIVALVRGSRNLIYIIALIAAWIVGFSTPCIMPATHGPSCRQPWRCPRLRRCSRWLRPGQDCPVYV